MRAVVGRFVVSSCDWIGWPARCRVIGSDGLRLRLRGAHTQRHEPARSESSIRVFFKQTTEG